jgi:hypothetical protein
MAHAPTVPEILRSTDMNTFRNDALALDRMFFFRAKRTVK